MSTKPARAGTSCSTERTPAYTAARRKCCACIRLRQHSAGGIYSVSTESPEKAPQAADTKRGGCHSPGSPLSPQPR